MMKNFLVALVILFPVLVSAQRTPFADSSAYKSWISTNLSGSPRINASQVRTALFGAIDMAVAYGPGSGGGITVYPSAESIFDTTIAINAKRYGVTGDGSTDDRVALQNAIYLAASSRKPLYLPKSTYRIASTQTVNSTTVGLYIPSYVTIFGDPEGTRIEYDGTASGISVLYSHQDSIIRLRDFRIGADSTGGSVSINLSFAYNVLIDNVTILKGTSYGVYGNRCERVTVSNSNIQCNGNSSEDCITFFNCKFLKISGNYLYGQSYYGNPKGSGINVISDSTPGKPRGYGHLVTDNEIENLVAGITMRFDSLAVISNNRLKKIWSFGIRMTSYPNGNEQLTGAKQIKIDGNFISQMGLDTTKSIAIVVTYGCGDISVTNNTIDTVFGCCGGGLGEGYAITNQGSQRFICIGNRIRQTKSSAIRNDGDFAIIANNYILNADWAAGNGRSIYNEGDYVSIVGNNMNEIGQSNQDYAIVDIGNYTSVEGNSGNIPLLKYRTGLGAPKIEALNFPSTAAGTSSELTVSFTGAMVGDMVDIGHGTIPANSSISAFVTGTNVVTVRFSNHSTTSIDPTLINFTINVKKYY